MRRRGVVRAGVAAAFCVILAGACGDPDSATTEVTAQPPPTETGVAPTSPGERPGGRPVGDAGEADAYSSPGDDDGGVGGGAESPVEPPSAPGQSPDPPLAPGQSEESPVEPPSAPGQSGETPEELPAVEVDLEPPTVMPAWEMPDNTIGTATLEIDRTLIAAMLGSFTAVSEVTLVIYHVDSALAATEPTRIVGETEGEFNLVMTAQGTGGGHETTGSGPVIWAIEGIFRPAPACTWELTVTETMQLSKVTSIWNSILGELPMPAGLGDDTVTEMPVGFDQTSVADAWIGGDDTAAAFILKDIVLPEGTGCTFPTP